MVKQSRSRGGSARAYAIATALMLAGCGSWFGESDDPPLPGTRISVMQQQQALTPDVGALAAPVVLPPPQGNSDWPQAGGDAAHSLQNVLSGELVQAVWRESIGEGTASDAPILPPPVVAAGRAYTMDTEHVVKAFDVATGGVLWRTDLAKDTDDDDALVGGIAYGNGRLFAATGFGDLVALDAGDGKPLWRQHLGVPMHGPPTVDGDRLFVVTMDDALHARSSVDGSVLWPPHQAIGEPASVLGTASPAVAAGTVVAGFSSGELVALRTDSGRVLWTESLGSPRRSDELSLIADIRARPVIHGNQVFAMSYAGNLAAFDLRTGQRLWEREIGGFNMPWLAGRYLFVVNSENQLLCLTTDTGSIIWIAQLQVFENETKLKDPIYWSGPVLSGDRLIVAGSHGMAISVSAYDGKIVGNAKLSAGTMVEPVVAAGTIYILSEDGSIAAIR